MTKMIFVNLPVKDIAASTRFYEAIGCVKNAMFSDDNASSMVWSDTITFQLLTHGHFANFTSRPIADAQATCQMLLALSRDSRADVDAIAEAAGKAGGTTDVREAMDMGFMYNRAFADPDGHIFEAAWMDMDAMTAADGEAG
ncbi:VOC family protein [Sphingopyxis panaciterrae]